MGHRHVFNTYQICETDNDRGLHHTDGSHLQFGNELVVAGGVENGSLLHPVDNMSINNTNFPSPWSPPNSNRYSLTSHAVEGPNNQTNHLEPSRDAYLHPSAVGSFCMVPENYCHYASSSSYSGQTFHGSESGIDLSTGGAYKRKSSCISFVNGRGSSIRNSFSASGGDTLRNVRSRTDIDLETNLVRIHLPSNPPHHSCTASGQINHLRPAKIVSQSINASAGEDATIFNHETSHYIIENSTSALPDIGGYSNDIGASRIPGISVPQYQQGTISQSAGGNGSSFSHLPIPTFQPSSSNLHVAHSDKTLPLVTESDSYIHARRSSNTGWRNSDRNGQGRLSNEGFRPLSCEAGFHDRVVSQGLTLAYRSAYGSRYSFDQHRDMRLDIDDMSYEELLALGERIGSVSTGLSEDMIVKCMMELIYCSSDETQEEGSCVICLEEYRNMDDIGMLKACRHDFHVGCIRKWLSLKNICPSCKSYVNG